MTIAVNRNLSNCEVARKKVFRASTGFEPVGFNCDGQIFISFVFPQFTSFHSMFHSFHTLMNSINWPASSSNPVEAPKTFFPGYLNCDSTAMVTVSFHKLFMKKLHIDHYSSVKQNTTVLTTLVKQ